MRARKLAGVLAAIVAITVAIAPGSAIAQQSSADGYGGEGGAVQTALGGGGNDNGSNGPEAAASQGTGETDSGSLPFTGLDIVLVLAGGMALVAAGVTVATLTPRGSRP